MDMIGRIRRLHSRKNKSEREISRITGLSRNTVAKWLHGDVEGPPKYRRGESSRRTCRIGENGGGGRHVVEANPVAPVSAATMRRCTP